jgi:hypothetical protein
VDKFYLVPIEVLYPLPDDPDRMARGPKYFAWKFNPAGISSPWNLMDYGFVPFGLLYARGISQADHDALILNSDVYNFPDDLDQPVTDPTIDVFFENFHIPTDWLTPSTTYRELLRQTAGMFQFNQRYGGLSGGHSIFEAADLDTRLRDMALGEQAWFLDTVASFGFDPGIVNTNSRLRQLVKMAGDFWAGQPFYMGGIEF